MSALYELRMGQVNTHHVVADIDVIVIDVQVRSHHHSQTNQIPFMTSHESFPVPRNLFSSSDDQSRSSIILSILSTTALPTRIINSFLPTVSSFVLELLSLPSNDNVKVITMALLICVTTPHQPPPYDDERAEIDRALSESMEEIARFEPASKSCFEGLKRVRVVGGDRIILGETCMVCLENKSVGEEVIRLDCSHVFHGDCIVKWLKTSHLCPLCRFSVS